MTNAEDEDHHGKRLESLRTDGRASGGKAGARRRGRKSVTIDLHAHIAIPRAAEFVKPHLDLATIPLAHYATPRHQGAQHAPGRRPHARVMTSYDQRLADLDAMGIDLQLVMCAPNQCYYTVPLDIAVQSARMVNDGIAEYVAGKPDRFVALGTVPMPDGAEAAKELERCMKVAQVQGRADPDQRGGTRAVRPRLRAVLEEGRGARRARAAASDRLHRRRSASRASTSTTSSAIRSRPRWRCTT